MLYNIKYVITCVMLGDITCVMLCYVTCVIVGYITCVMLYNMFPVI